MPFLCMPLLPSPSPQYRDLPPDALLVLCVHEAAPGRPGEGLLGSTCMRLFSKRGRLKTGPQRLRLWEGVPPCTANPSRTPGKVRNVLT